MHALSRPPDATSWPDGEYAQHMTHGTGKGIACTLYPCVAFHTIMYPSCDAVSTCRPSGAQSTHTILADWLRKSARRRSSMCLIGGRFAAVVRTVSVSVHTHIQSVSFISLDRCIISRFRRSESTRCALMASCRDVNMRGVLSGSLCSAAGFRATESFVCHLSLFSTHLHFSPKSDSTPSLNVG